MHARLGPCRSLMAAWSVPWPCFLSLFLIHCSLGLPCSAFAGLIITVNDTAVDPGKTGFVDVFVRSNAAGADVLDAFSLHLSITPLSGQGLLQFTNPALDPQ